MGVDILQAAGMRRYAARRIGHRFEIIDKLSTRRLAKERLKRISNLHYQGSLEREAELLKDDNISFDDQHWVDIES